MVTFLFYTASAVLVLGALIFVHELGHFLFAKLSGVTVLRFSLGFGPKLFGRKIGHTEYVVSAIPLGGYVKMLGEGEEEEDGEGDEDESLRNIDPATSFAVQPIRRRFGIVIAGPLFNLIFAWLCLVVVALAWGVSDFTDEPIVGTVAEDMPAAVAGLEPNDRIVEIDGESIASWSGDLTRVIRASDGRDLLFRLERDGETREVTIAPQRKVVRNVFGEEQGELFQIGITPATVTLEQSVLEAPVTAFWQISNLTQLIVLSITKMVRGQVSAKEIGGPITIARYAGERAQGGLRALLEFMAFLGVNLGILNLLPIPVLDGGHLVFLGFEAVFRRPLKGRARDLAQQVGLFLLVGLMLFAVFNDISRWVQGS